MYPVIVSYKFEVRIFTCSWVNGDSQNRNGPWLCPHYLYPTKNLICPAYILFSYVQFFKQFSTAVLSGGCEPPILGKRRGGRRGSGMVIVRKSVGEFLKAVHSKLFLYLYAFQRYCRFCSPARHFSLPHLYSPQNFTNVPPGLYGSPFGYKEPRCRANCPCN